MSKYPVRQIHLSHGTKNILRNARLSKWQTASVDAESFWPSGNDRKGDGESIANELPQTPDGISTISCKR